MGFLLRFIITLAAIAGVLVLVLGGLFTTGNLGLFPGLDDMVENVLSPQTVNVDEPAEQRTTGGAVEAPVLRFTWRNDEILYNDQVISEEEFARLLDEAKAQGAKVEITKFSDVTVEAADRWRLLLDQVEVRYEIISQE
jgi:hypothetical protein